MQGTLLPPRLSCYAAFLQTTLNQRELQLNELPPLLQQLHKPELCPADLCCLQVPPGPEMASGLHFQNTFCEKPTAWALRLYASSSKGDLLPGLNTHL